MAGMRADEDATVTQRGKAGLPELFNPGADERHFIARDEERRTEVQEKRAAGDETHVCAERLARGRWSSIEPVVKELRSGDAH
jgi:hypothetical protein